MANINRFTSIQQVQDQYLNQKGTSQKVSTPEVSFQDILSQKQKEVSGTQELKFSKHASARLETRQIEMTDEQMERLTTGAQMAGEKGIKDSLIMVDSLAFIVNIPNQTVVTAIDQSEATNNIFTNIDGAVVI